MNMAMMKAYEGTALDRKRDKKSKSKEGSPAEEAEDRHQIMMLTGGKAITAAKLKRLARAYLKMHPHG